jgi:hypothetical protein
MTASFLRANQLLLGLPQRVVGGRQLAGALVDTVVKGAAPPFQ